MFDKNYTTFVPDRSDWQYNGFIFTDGSRSDHSPLAGAGVYVQTDGEELVFPLGHHTTVFQAEVYAQLICAKLENLCTEITVLLQFALTVWRP